MRTEQEDLQCHIQIVHLIGSKTYECKKCDGEFDSTESLNHHNKTCRKSSPHNTYNHCENSSSVNEDLKGHIKSVHEVSGVFKCQPCNKAFSDQVNLISHMENEHDK